MYTGVVCIVVLVTLRSGSPVRRIVQPKSLPIESRAIFRGGMTVARALQDAVGDGRPGDGCSPDSNGKQQENLKPATTATANLDAI